MRAIHVTRFGGPEVLSIVDVPDPTPGPGELAIDVTHAAVGLIDVLFRSGAFATLPGMPQPPFVPGLEVAGTVRALGAGVTGFAVGEPVVTLSGGGGVGGYAEIYVGPAAHAISLAGHAIDPALAVAVVPNAAMAHVALAHVAHLAPGETVLVHGALGGFAAACPGIAKQLGAARVVGTVRATKLAAAARSKLPYDAIVDSAELATALAGERFDVVIDPVGGALRSRSLDSMKPGGRLLAVGNASGDWSHAIDTNQLWLRNAAIAGFNAGGFFPAHPQLVRPALAAALTAVAAGLGSTEVDVLPLDQAAAAHERMAERSLAGRIVLAT